jgi:hypothetical protein
MSRECSAAVSVADAPRSSEFGLLRMRWPILALLSVEWVRMTAV